MLGWEYKRRDSSGRPRSAKRTVQTRSIYDMDREGGRSFGPRRLIANSSHKSRPDVPGIAASGEFQILDISLTLPPSQPAKRLAESQPGGGGGACLVGPLTNNHPSPLQAVRAAPRSCPAKLISLCVRDAQLHAARPIPSPALSGLIFREPAAAGPCCSYWSEKNKPEFENCSLFRIGQLCYNRIPRNPDGMVGCSVTIDE